MPADRSVLPTGITSIPALLTHLGARTRLSDRAMATYIGVAHNMVSRWKKLELNPDPDSCRKIAAWAGLPPEYVLQLAGHLAPAGEAPAEDPVIPEIRAELADYSPEEQRRLVLPALHLVRVLRRDSAAAAAPPPASTPGGSDSP